MRNELLEEFAGFTEIDSVSFGERRMADLLKEKLRALGFETEEDDAGSHYGGNAGNVYGFLKGSLSGEPVLFPPTWIRWSRESEKSSFSGRWQDHIRWNDGAGCRRCGRSYGDPGGIRRVLSSGKPHRDIEVLFPIAEEVYTKGTRVFDFSKIRSKEAYVLDLSGPVGSAAVQAPSLISFVLTIHGKAAHAGFEPEKGIHAVTAAALAIARLPQGHVEEDTTLNIGLIRGGTATNIVPESCIVEGEIRSYSHEKALSYMEAVRRVFREEAEKSGGSLEDEVSINLVAYHTGEEEASVKNFRRAAKNWVFPGTDGDLRRQRLQHLRGAWNPRNRAFLRHVSAPFHEGIYHSGRSGEGRGSRRRADFGRIRRGIG
ncbi:MAG: peptidase dimerization domain-containing protein [Lachnospiraceae bacterium]